MEKMTVKLENAAQQQQIENFAAAIAKVIATGIKQSPSADEVEYNIRGILQTPPSEELEKSVMSLVNDGLTLADETVLKAFKDALWANSREIVHEIIDLLFRQGLIIRSKAE